MTASTFNALAEGMRQAVTADRDELATKADLAALRGEIAELRTATKGDFTALRAEIAAVRVEGRIIGAIVLAMAAKMFGISNAVAGVLS